MLANSWNFKRFGSDSTFCETKLPPAKPSFEDSVLLEQVDHSGLLVTLEPTSDGDHQQAQGLDRVRSKYSCGFPMVETEQPAKPFTGAHLCARTDATGRWLGTAVIPSCAKTRPSRHRRKNCAYRNQAKTLAREQVTRRPPTLDCGSTIWTRRERKRSRFYLNIGVARVTAFRVPHTATTADR